MSPGITPPACEYCASLGPPIVTDRAMVVGNSVSVLSFEVVVNNREAISLAVHRKTHSAASRVALRSWGTLLSGMFYGIVLRMMKWC